MTSAHIVLGLDGSPGSSAACAWVVEHAAKLDADVTVLHVVGPLLEFVPPTTDATVPFTFDESLHRDLAADLEQWCVPLRAAGIECRARLVDGDPSETIIEVAERVGADLVVVGGHGRTGFGELALASVAHHLTHDCARPVLVVPAPD